MEEAPLDTECRDTEETDALFDAVDAAKHLATAETRAEIEQRARLQKDLNGIERKMEEFQDFKHQYTKIVKQFDRLKLQFTHSEKIRKN